MAIITKLPKQFEKAFANLISMSDDQFNDIIDSLEKVGLVFSPRILGRKIDVQKNIPSTKIEDIFAAVSSLIPLVDNNEISKEDLIVELCNVIKETQTKELNLKDGSEATFKNRLLKLLDNKSLFISSKAVELISENENLFLSARINSDIRTIFNEHSKETTECALIINTLHIHFRHGEEQDHKDLFIALDTKDLNNLKKSIEKAEQDNKALKSVIEKAGLIYLPTEDNL
jgi:hypothetical protein